MNRFAINWHNVILYALHVQSLGNAHETKNMCECLLSALHAHKITFEFIHVSVLNKHSEITLKLGKFRLNDTCSKLQRKHVSGALEL